MVELFRPSARARGKQLDCTSCGLYEGCLSPMMAPAGDAARGIMNIGEAPGEIEDRRGKPWQGKVGRRLSKAYRDLGIDLFGDCVNLNSVNCRPPDNRDPSPHEINCCRAVKVDPAIHHYRPHVIVVFGNAALQSIIGHRWPRSLGGIERWRGWAIPDRHLGAWICPTYHPSFVERYGEPQAETVWRQDLQRAIQCTDTPLPAYSDERRCVEVVESDAEIERVLREIQQAGEAIAFDYETTGLKPHAEGHRIVSVSIATSSDHVYAFLMPEEGTRAYKALRRLLVDTHVPKIAQNLKFEEHWSRACLDLEVGNWAWDTMLATHILDNRPGVTGLKFQAYVRFGVMDYDSHIEPYLKSNDDTAGANAFNRIDEGIRCVGERELLIYNGIDSLLEYRLAQQQMQELGVNNG